MLKAITGGDLVQLQEKYKNPFSYRPTVKLIFSVNRLPNIKDTTYGFERRVDIVPFKIRFVRKPVNPNEKKLIPDIKNKLLDELGGIFAFAIEGLKRLKNRRYKFPKCTAIDAEREEYKKEMNQYLNFIKECLTVVPPDERASTPKQMIQKNKEYERLFVFSKSNKKMRESSMDIHSAFVGWFAHAYGTKTLVVGSRPFMSEFRSVMEKEFGFVRQRVGDVTICTNEEDSGGKTYFYGLSLNKESKQYKELGERIKIQKDTVPPVEDPFSAPKMRIVESFDEFENDD
jgi:phage/plasmid-associated DNA primase